MFLYSKERQITTISTRLQETELTYNIYNKGQNCYDRYLENATWRRAKCYDLRSLEWNNKTTLVLSNTRELNRVPKTK